MKRIHCLFYTFYLIDDLSILEHFVYKNLTSFRVKIHKFFIFVHLNIHTPLRHQVLFTFEEDRRKLLIGEVFVKSYQSQGKC